MPNDKSPPAGVDDYFSGGWGAVEGAQPSEEDIAVMEAEKERVELQRINDAKLFHSTFSKGNGAKVLQILRSMTIEQPCFNPEVGESAANMGFTREGQNSIVRYIEQQMRTAEDGKRDTKKRGTI